MARRITIPGADRILVIDDDAAVLEAMVEVLTLDGYTPTATTDPRQGLRLLDGGGFDLVVSDVVMPHLTGLELLDLAKRRNPEVQVLLVTAYSTRDVALDALRKGAAGFLEKPFAIDKFRAAAHEALRRAHASRTARP